MIRAASNEEPFDGFTTARLFDHFVQVSGGITSLPGILSLVTGAQVDPGVARSRVVEMYRKYGDQIRNYLAAERPDLRPRPARPAKEVERDLFSATR